MEIVMLMTDKKDVHHDDFDEMVITKNIKVLVRDWT